MERMTDKQEEHLQYILLKFKLLADRKYRAGAKEHGGELENISPHNILDMALDEAIDQVVYLITLREQLLGVKIPYGPNK